MYIISDTHFGHRNIIGYCSRPFKNIADMNDTMVSNWNMVVGKNDVVYHLGDFAIGSKKYIESIVSRLNGYKILIKGNHDRGIGSMLSMGFDEVYKSLSLTFCNKKLLLQHYPPINNEHVEFDYVLHGHIHNKVLENCPKNIINVSVEMLDYKPVMLYTIVS